MFYFFAGRVKCGIGLFFKENLLAKNIWSRSQLEETLTGQIWGNMSIKVNNDNNEL